MIKPGFEKQTGLTLLQGVSYYLSGEWKHYDRHTLRAALTDVNRLQNEIIDDMYQIHRDRTYGPNWHAVGDRIR